MEDMEDNFKKFKNLSNKEVSKLQTENKRKFYEYKNY